MLDHNKNTFDGMTDKTIAKMLVKRAMNDINRASELIRTDPEGETLHYIYDMLRLVEIDTGTEREKLLHPTDVEEWDD